LDLNIAAAHHRQSQQDQEFNTDYYRLQVQHDRLVEFYEENSLFKNPLGGWTQREPVDTDFRPEDNNYILRRSPNFKCPMLGVFVPELLKL
jgi:hypothetical protein